MGYTADKFCGYIQDGRRISNYSGDQLCQMIMQMLQEETQYRNIPARITQTTVRSGGMIFGTTCPLIEIAHPTERYSIIGVMINGNILSFPFLSLSNQMRNVRAKQVGVVNQNSSFLTKQLFKGDLAKIQQEDYWHAQILSCINDYIG